jgi:protein SCO1/2
MESPFQKRTAAFLSAATLGLLVFWVAIQVKSKDGSLTDISALSRTLIAQRSTTPLNLPELIASDGRKFGAQKLRGHWSIIFFGFTKCPLVCPKTLGVLSAALKQLKGGAKPQRIQAIFVSVDPAHDTPQHIRDYLQHFDHHIIGLTGNRIDIDRFTREIGAGYKRNGSSIDHSTSLFVVDPTGHLCGLMLHPSQPSVVVSDFEKLRHDLDRDFISAQ